MQRNCSLRPEPGTIVPSPAQRPASFSIVRGSAACVSGAASIAAKTTKVQETQTHFPTTKVPSQPHSSARTRGGGTPDLCRNYELIGTPVAIIPFWRRSLSSRQPYRAARFHFGLRGLAVALPARATAPALQPAFALEVEPR